MVPRRGRRGARARHWDAPVNERLLNELYNEIRRFRLAEADMEMALAAARHLANLDRPLTPMDRSIETGLVVSFARVFRNSKIGTLDEEDWGGRHQVMSGSPTCC